MPVSPMFPLGTVLLPGMFLPLHIFEPRYRQMLEDCRVGDGTFGVVLIERGSEVGGGDVRADVGTLARIVEARQLPDGRWLLAAIGEERIRVERWLADDPYPRAEIAAWPDSLEDADRADASGGPTGPSAGATPDFPAGGQRDAAVRLLRRASALLAELGQPAPPLQLTLPDDPVGASYQAIAMSPLGLADRQRLLAAPSLPDRWRLLHDLLTDQVELLQAQLAGGPGD